MIVVVSFWGYDEFSIYPAFQFDNYEFLLTGRRSPTRCSSTPSNTPLITWAFTLVIGFTVAYFLAFHVRSLTWQIALCSCSARSRSGPPTSSG